MDYNRYRSKKGLWWNRKTRLEKLTLTIATIIILLLLLIIIFILRNQDGDKNSIVYEKYDNDYVSVIKLKNGKKICLTQGCVNSAAEVIRQMDENVDPCDDFFNFACGNYVKNAKIPNDKTYVNAFTIINDQLQEQLKSLLEEQIRNDEPNAFKVAKNYYKSCTNTGVIEKKGLHEAKRLLHSLGGWPVLSGDSWEKNNFSWMDTIYALRKTGLETNVMIDFSVGFDLKNTSRRIIQLDQPTLGLSREFFIKGEKNEIVKAYYDYMVDVAVLFGAEREKAERELHESLIFEMHLASYSLSQEERRNITNLYNLMSIKQLQNIIKSIPWMEYLNNLLPKNVQVNENENVLVGVPTFLSQFEALVKRSTKRIQANYLMWRTVQQIIPYLNQDLRDRLLKYRHIVDGIEEIPPRWKQCIDFATDHIPIIVGSLYVRKYFNEDAKGRALEIVKYIKKTFKMLLKTVDWMDKETKQSALEKAESIVDHIAYPDELLDDNKMENMYNSLEIQQNNFLYSTLNISKFEADFFHNRLRKPVNKTDWIDHGNPAQVNAFYHSSENSIIFPAGILQGVLFNKDRPRYMNYGAIGSVIGHEITHGFDDTGRQFDQDGNLINWWEKRTQEAFLKKAQCIIRQYDNYTVPEVNQNLNGVKTLGENIADNGGVKEAYLAYLKWISNNQPEPELPGLQYNPLQMFWISAAQNWCSRHRPESIKLQIETDAHVPERYRVLGPFSNLKYFADDFKCPSGSRMNPVNKCLVW